MDGLTIGQHDAHVDAYKVRSIMVVRNEWSVSKFDRYFATFGDYDLDCQMGYGSTPLEAKQDLCFAANVELGE